MRRIIISIPLPFGIRLTIPIGKKKKKNSPYGVKKNY